MWKKPMIQKTEFDSAHFEKMTQEEMDKTTGSGYCFIFGGGDSLACFVGGSTGGSSIDCVIIGSSSGN